MMTPFQAWHGVKPDLSKLWVFGSRVCVKRTSKRRCKLDRHDFSGIFLGYTARTDENIKYVDVNSRIVKTSHHTMFDEAWYLQPRRPPFAQMLYDVGSEYFPDKVRLHQWDHRQRHAIQHAIIHLNYQKRHALLLYPFVSPAHPTFTFTLQQL